MTTALNTLNGFTILERGITNETLNLKLSEYRNNLAKLSNPEYANSAAHINGEVLRLERMLLTGKAIAKI